MPPYFIDFEAFQYQSHYTMKELCIIDVDKPFSPLYFLFGPSTKWQDLEHERQRQHEYQTREIHHIEWNEGVTRNCPKCVMYHIKQWFPLWSSGIFYVMDRHNGQKMKFLKEKLPQLNIVNYNMTFNNLPMISGNIACIYREHGEHCAYLKCVRLCSHYMNAMII